VEGSGGPQPSSMPGSLLIFIGGGPGECCKRLREDGPPWNTSSSSSLPRLYGLAGKC